MKKILETTYYVIGAVWLPMLSEPVASLTVMEN